MLTTVLTKGAIYIFWTLNWTVASYYSASPPYSEFKNHRIATTQNQCMVMATQEWEKWYLTTHGQNEYFYTSCTNNEWPTKIVLIKCNYKGLCSTSYSVDPDGEEV